MQHGRGYAWLNAFVIVSLQVIGALELNNVALHSFSPVHSYFTALLEAPTEVGDKKLVAWTEKLKQVRHAAALMKEAQGHDGHSECGCGHGHDEECDDACEHDHDGHHDHHHHGSKTSEKVSESQAPRAVADDVLHLLRHVEGTTTLPLVRLMNHSCDPNVQ